MYIRVSVHMTVYLILTNNCLPVQPLLLSCKCVRHYIVVLLQLTSDEIALAVIFRPPSVMVPFCARSSSFKGVSGVVPAKKNPESRFLSSVAFLGHKSSPSVMDDELFVVCIWQHK